MADALAEQKYLHDALLGNNMVPRELAKAVAALLKTNAAFAEALVPVLLMDAKDEMLSEAEVERDSGEDADDDDAEDDDEDEDKDKSSGENHGATSKSKKRKAEKDTPVIAPGPVLKWKKCLNCHEAYNYNRPNACRFHPGEKQVNTHSDAWKCIDATESEYDEWEERVPDGFDWDCCGRVATDERGCVRRPHESKPVHKRRK